MKKLVLTGAAGRLGSYLREPLSKMCDTLVSTDIAEDVGALYRGESYVKADLASLEAMQQVIDGADMVIHFGAIADELDKDGIALLPQPAEQLPQLPALQPVACVQSPQQAWQHLAHVESAHVLQRDERPLLLAASS